MPFVWQDPEIALIHRGVRIYHTYKNDNADSMCTYYYSFGMGSDDPEFDVRDHKCPYDWDVEKEKDRLGIIRLAIERGDLPVPEECQPDCKHENLCIDKYMVIGAAASVELDRHASVGEVIGFQFNRLDGEVVESVFYCKDCGESFKWAEVKGF